MTAAIGTSNAPAPLAVYSMPALAAANLAPKVSPWVAGNRLKISPYTPKYSAVTQTNTTGLRARLAESKERQRADGEGDGHRVFAADLIRHPAEEWPARRRRKSG